jgi:hypothetical protein
MDDSNNSFISQYDSEPAWNSQPAWNQQDAAKKAAMSHFSNLSQGNNQGYQSPIKSTQDLPMSSYQGSMGFKGNNGKGLSTLNNVYGAITGSPLISSTSTAGGILSALGFL